MMVTSGADSTAADHQPAGVDDNVDDAVPPRIDRCGTRSGGPMLLKCDEPAVISVDVTGRPAPDVQWHVAGRRVRKSARYRAAMAGQRHTLTVLRVTDELEKGVWVMATNMAGEDSCLVTVKTYKVLTGLPNTFHDSVQNARQSVAILSRKSTDRYVERPFSPEARELGVTSPTPSDWNSEMAVRNRMRSVDDLMYYGRWKRESLQALSGKPGGGRQTDNCSVDGAVSLNQSYSCASTAATDDEAQRPGQRRRRSIRIRRRSTRGAGLRHASEDSIVSAPVPRGRVNLDESVGSGALDVESMFRFFASSTPAPVADEPVFIPSEKPPGLQPSGAAGLPPSGAPGGTTSVRRTSLRRRRTVQPAGMTDMTGGSTDTVSSTFDDVQMTSSTADVTAAVQQPQVDVPGAADRSRPVRKLSLRRRRRTGDSPSPAAPRHQTESADGIEVEAAPASTAATTSVDVSATGPLWEPPGALWELCGEKLNVVCQRLLDVTTSNVDTELIPSVDNLMKVEEEEKDNEEEEEQEQEEEEEEEALPTPPPEVFQPSAIVDEPFPPCAAPMRLPEVSQAPEVAEESPPPLPSCAPPPLLPSEVLPASEVMEELLPPCSPPSRSPEVSHESEIIIVSPTSAPETSEIVEESLSSTALHTRSSDVFQSSEIIEESLLPCDPSTPPSDVLQGSEVVEQSLPASVTETESQDAEPGRNSHGEAAETGRQANVDETGEMRPRNSSVFYNIDLSALRLSLIPDVVPDNEQTASRLSAAASKVTEEEDSYDSQSDSDDDLPGIGSSRHISTNDEVHAFSDKTKSVNADDLRQQCRMEPAVNDVSPVVKQLQSAISPESCRDRQQLENGRISNEERTAGGPLTVDVDDAELQNHRASKVGSNIVEHHSRSSGLDIGAMLSPSVDLHDILETIYTLTGGGGVDGSSAERQSTERLHQTDEGIHHREQIPRRENSTGLENDRRPLPTDSRVSEVDGQRTAAARLDHTDDDEDDEGSLDLDTETYDCDLTPVAADIADSLHLADSEDFDDLDIADNEYDEYDLDDDDIV